MTHYRNHWWCSVSLVMNLPVSQMQWDIFTRWLSVWNFVSVSGVTLNKASDLEFEARRNNSQIFYRPSGRVYQGHLSNSGVTVSMLSLGTDWTCNLLPSDILKSFRIVCVKICADGFLSLSAIPWNVAVPMCGIISALAVWVLPRGSRDPRGQNQDRSGD